MSGSYILSEEKFWRESNLADVIPSFKLRAAWGQSGNLTAIGVYDRATNYGPVIYGGQAGSVSPLLLGNPGIQPERQTELELGADISMLKDRLSLEFTYFNKDVKDLILNRTLAPSTGFNNRLLNIGNMTNKGFEFMIKGVPVQTKNFSWVSNIINYGVKPAFTYYLNTKNTLHFGLQSTYYTFKPGKSIAKEDERSDEIVLRDKHALESAIYLDHEWKPTSRFGIQYGARLSGFHSWERARLLLCRYNARHPQTPDR